MTSFPGDERTHTGTINRLDSAAKARVIEHYDRTSPSSFRPRSLMRFYYEDLYSFVRDHIPPGSSVLDLGCGEGDLLASLRPSRGVGVDISMQTVRRAQAKHPDLDFVCGDIEQLPITGEFDYVLVSNVAGFLLDAWAFFRRLNDISHPGTRVIVTYYNFAWEPLLKLAERVGLKRREPLQNWLSRLDLVNLVQLADFEPVASGYRTPLPFGPSRLARPLNRLLSSLPILKRFGIISYAIARPRSMTGTSRVSEPTCSIVIPTRNERGNIEPAIRRLPRLGRHTEVIFVDGNSTDGTPDEIERVISSYPQWDIKLLHQGEGVGKGDAVRKGFAAAAGDVLMILDADLTVPPEDLPKFWSALVEDRGEFINGTRLVYPMEGEAMRLANIAGNKFFSLLFSWILDQRITDTLCGTKVLWADDYRKIAANRHRFGDFDPFGDFDLLFGAANLGLKIRELPIRYRNRTYGDTNIDRWRHGLLLLKMAFIGARTLRLR